MLLTDVLHHGLANVAVDTGDEDFLHIRTAPETNDLARHEGFAVVRRPVLMYYTFY